MAPGSKDPITPVRARVRRSRCKSSTGHFILATINGTPGNDSLTGTADADTISGGDGNDTIVGLAGDDTLVGGAGNDILYGNMGNDIVLGNQGNDTIYAGQGNDTVYGGQGDDNVFGNEGIDTIYAGEGIDSIDGGPDNDTVVFAGPYSRYVATRIADGRIVIVDRSGAEGIKYLTNVETMQFNGSTIQTSTITAATRNLYMLGDSITEGAYLPSPATENWTVQVANARGVNQFTRAYSGYTAAQMKVYFDSDTAYRDRVHIIWLGRNAVKDVNATLTAIAGITSQITHGRFLILGVLTDVNEYANVAPTVLYPTDGWDVDQRRAAVLSLNQQLAVTYGLNYIFMREESIRACGTTAADTMNSTFTMPGDTVHPNAWGCDVIDAFVQGHLTIRGW